MRFPSLAALIKIRHLEAQKRKNTEGRRRRRDGNLFIKKMAKGTPQNSDGLSVKV